MSPCRVMIAGSERTAMFGVHALASLRHGLVLAALFAILLVRVGVPAGWMPMAGADGGIVLVPCSGMGAMKMAHAPPVKTAMPDTAMSAMDMGMAMRGMDLPAQHAVPEGAKKHHPDPGGDHPCSGAGVSVALEVPIASVPAALSLPPSGVRPARLIPGIGCGLAAPPPPSTGPPLLV